MYTVILRYLSGSGYGTQNRRHDYPSKENFDQHVRGTLAANHIEIVEEGITEERANELTRQSARPYRRYREKTFFRTDGDVDGVEDGILFERNQMKFCR